MRVSIQTPNMGVGGGSSGKSRDISGEYECFRLCLLSSLRKPSEHHIHVQYNHTRDAKQSVRTTWVTQIKQWGHNRKQHLDRVVRGTCAAWPLACLFKPKHRLYLSLYTKLCLSVESCREQTAWQFKGWAVFWTRPPHQKLSNVKPVSTSRTLEVILTEAKSLYL